MRSTPPNVQRRVLGIPAASAPEKTVEDRDVVLVLQWEVRHGTWRMQHVAPNELQLRELCSCCLFQLPGCRSLVCAARKASQPCCDTVVSFLPSQLQFFVVERCMWLCSTKPRLWTRRLKSKLFLHLTQRDEGRLLPSQSSICVGHASLCVNDA